MGKLTIIYIMAAIAAAVLGSSVVTYCTKRDTSTDNHAVINTEHTQVLAGREYHAAHENGTPITLQFAPEGNRFHGRVVNNFNGSYSIDGDSISFTPPAANMMMGLPNAMSAENDFFKFLVTVDRFEISDDAMTLHGGGKSMKFEETE